MAGNVLEVNDSNFKQEVLDAGTPVLVDFWAAWCGPCRALAPTVEAVATENVGKLKVCKVDVDSSPNVAGQFAIRSIPTLLFFKSGENVGQLIGNVPKSAIDDLITKV
ncbi:MAG: thioredoxin [Deltaproteobacteria bacterium]|jgi:thioredoxin 1|nr:thioredoxin [Deltaproteobacteria bacterium]